MVFVVDVAPVVVVVVVVGAVLVAVVVGVVVVTVVVGLRLIRITLPLRATSPERETRLGFDGATVVTHGALLDIHKGGDVVVLMYKWSRLQRPPLLSESLTAASPLAAHQSRVVMLVDHSKAKVLRRILVSLRCAFADVDPKGEGQCLRGRNRIQAPAGLPGVKAVAPSRLFATNGCERSYVSEALGSVSGAAR